MDVVRGDVTKKSLKGSLGKKFQHFSVCTSAILHFVWKGTDSDKKATLVRGSFRIPWSYSINMCTERYRGSKGAVEGMVYGDAKGDLSLFCPLRLETYWPATAWTEKCPAVRFALHRLAHSLIYWWHGQYLDVSLSTLRTGTKGIAVTSNVNSLQKCPHPSPPAGNDSLAAKHGAQFSSAKEGFQEMWQLISRFFWHTSKKGITSELHSEAMNSSTRCSALKLLKLFADNHWWSFLTCLCDVRVLWGF